MTTNPPLVASLLASSLILTPFAIRFAHHRIHNVMSWVINSIPTAVSDSVVMGMHAGIRVRGMKKAAKLAKGE